MAGDEMDARLGRIEGRVERLERDITQTRADVSQLRGEHVAMIAAVEGRITKHLEKQDVHLEKQDAHLESQGKAISEMYLIEVRRETSDRATREADAHAKMARKYASQRRMNALKVVAVILGLPAALMGFFASFHSIATWLRHLFP